MGRFHQLVGPMRRGGPAVVLELDLKDVVAITDIRNVDGGVMLEGGGYNWTVWGQGDEQIEALRAAWREARGS